MSSAPLIPARNSMEEISPLISHDKPQISRARLAVLLAIFLVSGVATPIFIGLLRFAGAVEKKTFFYLFPNYVAMSLMWFVPSGRAWAKAINWRLVGGTVFIDLIAQGMVYFGMILAGPMLYTVIYASVTIWCAVLSRMLLRSVLTMGQWISCVIVTVGVSLASIDANSSGDQELLGAVVCLTGSILHALTYVIMEYNMSRGAEPLAPEQLCSYMGIGGTVTYAVYIGIVVLPNISELFLDPIAAEGDQILSIVLLYIGLSLAFFLHAYTFYNMLEYIGSTTAGVLKGLTAVSVFVCSEVFLCDRNDPTRVKQCFTTYKGVSLLAVLLGVSLYTYAKNKQANLDKRMNAGVLQTVGSKH